MEMKNLKEKEEGGTRKKEEFGKGGNGAALMMFRNGMQCNFQIAH